MSGSLMTVLKDEIPEDVSSDPPVQEVEGEEAASASLLARLRDLLDTLVGSQSQTDDVPTFSYRVVFPLEIYPEGGESAEAYFSSPRSIEQLAEEQREFLRRVGDDRVDIDY